MSLSGVGAETIFQQGTLPQLADKQKEEAGAAPGGRPRSLVVVH